MTILELTPPQIAIVSKLEGADPSLVRVIIRNWKVLNFHDTPDDKGCLFGDVENHPKLGNQRDVRTSRLIYLNETVGLAVTLNTVYILKDKAP